MKILYALQGTGNGHAARARHLVPLLAKHAEVDVWISGTESQLDLPVPVARYFSGISLKYGKRGGLSYVKTLLGNPLGRFVRDVFRVNLAPYDLIVNDFEPITAWAVRLRGGTLVEVSHQAGVRHPAAPRPKQRQLLAEWVLRYYAPSERAVGFHVKAYGPGIFPPPIRAEVRNQVQTPQRQVLVYLPAYRKETLVARFAQSPVPVYAFVPRLNQPEQHGALRLMPVQSEGFLSAFAASDSVICSAGFELPTEALYHGKRLAVIPIKGQYEQECNALALRQVGAWTARSLRRLKVEKWLQSPPPAPARWPDLSSEIVQTILAFAKPTERPPHPSEADVAAP